jgi:hypothetical protein
MVSELPRPTTKPRDIPTAKAISDKIDNCIIRSKTPVGPKGQHDANVHADGWNDAIKAIQKAIEPNLQALEMSAEDEDYKHKEWAKWLRWAADYEADGEWSEAAWHLVNKVIAELERATKAEGSNAEAHE